MNNKRVTSKKFIFILVICGLLIMIGSVLCLNAAKKPVSETTKTSEDWSDEALPEGDFITKGNWTVFKFKFTYGIKFDISSVPNILDRFEKEHPKLCVQKGDWQIVYNPLSSYPHGILFRHYPTPTNLF